MSDKYCLNCNKPLSIANCYLSRGYLRSLCKICDNQQRVSRLVPNSQRLKVSRLIDHRLWAIKNRAKIREYQARRKSLILSTSIERVNYQVIYERDQGICHICLSYVSIDNCHFDHIIPLSRGGDHSYENIKVSCARCNLIKNDRLIGEY